jgi:hypothetical protein
MEWWIIAALTIVILVLIAMYCISYRESRALTAYVLLILLDEGVHAAQRAGLVDYVRAIEARNKWDLYVKVGLATHRLAAKHSGPAVVGLLWGIKEQK